MTKNTHHWRFFRAGGFDQARIESGADILALEDLDQKLWVALACPVEGLYFDAEILRMLDRDNDGRVRASDLLTEVRWLKSVLGDPEELVRDGEDLRLSAIDGTSPEGARVLASARCILANLGRPDAQTVALADTLDTERIFASTRFNGDGVIPAATAEDAGTRAVIKDIIVCLGAETDRSGAPGINQQKIDVFYDGIVRHAVWLDREKDLDGTAAAAETVLVVRDKIDGFFLRCRLAAYSIDAAVMINPGAEAFSSLADKGVADSLAMLRPLPLAAVSADGMLPLQDGVNPAWADALSAFRREAVLPLLGERDRLSAGEWEVILSRYAGRLEWMAEKPETPVAVLGDARILEIRAAGAKPVLDALIGEDEALEGEAAAIDAVERLIRLRMGFYRLVNNFVSFRDFYTRRKGAVFLAGTLYLDGRSADLCIRVQDPGRHAVLAGLSRIYLVYCDCTRKGGGEKISIAAAFTAGDADQLMVGRNGVFYDRDGGDWDATIVKLIDHPISVRQAFWSPYKQMARLINEQIGKVAAAAQNPVQVVQLAVTPAAPAAPAATPSKAPVSVAPPAASAPPAFDVARFAGIFAAIGLALGAIGTAVATVVTGFLRMSWWQMPLATAGLLLVISGPSVIIAYMKLRQRSLAPILDATGWAVNARVRINIPFGGSLTSMARLPEGAERSLADPYAEKRRPWGLYITLLGVLLAALAAWRFGLAGWLLG
ncbi:hypothetical protein [Telmatospirillum siberiense]|uniref:EF-hand domain-containing protein n=1 Tax=Telmatospirillum siberiense TaxID=382514 RepID=A0A2N3Q0V1_9PROT|nr:hypothetical protein [Telmatospirillum siberiense]PKU26295.1 hypothetical protein CWS72_00090 [Telmatospirillum siberiense]